MKNKKYHTVGTVPTYDRNKQKIPHCWNFIANFVQIALMVIRTHNINGDRHVLHR